MRCSAFFSKRLESFTVKKMMMEVKGWMGGLEVGAHERHHPPTLPIFSVSSGYRLRVLLHTALHTAATHHLALAHEETHSTPLLALLKAKKLAFYSGDNDWRKQLLPPHGKSDIIKHDVLDE